MPGGPVIRTAPILLVSILHAQAPAFRADLEAGRYLKVRAEAEQNGLVRDIAKSVEAVKDTATRDKMKTEVTQVAGRGVGMDVVKSEITSLGGRVDAASFELLVR